MRLPFERIVGSAIRYNGIVYSVLRPGRHGDCFRLLHERFPDSRYIGLESQGFVTNWGRFVDRVKAKQIAIAAKQLLPKEHGSRELFSEDVW